MVPMRTAHRTDQKGLTVIELVIAVGVIAVVVTSAFFAISRGIIANRRAKLLLVAAQDVNSKIDHLRIDSVNWLNARNTAGCIVAPFPEPGNTGSLCDGTHDFTPTIQLPNVTAGTYVVSDTIDVHSDIRRVDFTLSFTFGGKTETVQVTTFIAREGLNRI